MAPVSLTAEAVREDVINMARGTNDIALLQRIQRYMKRCFHAKAKEEEEYISKQEVLDGIRESLMEIKEAQREGRELPDIKVLLNELRS